MDAVQSLQRTGTREHLPEFMDFIEQACEEARASEDAAYALRLVVEEVCLNLMNYGYAGMRP
jgi:anti-sigma regulatory factor (Ser/Thr protein kinase)